MRKLLYLALCMCFVLVGGACTSVKGTATRACDLTRQSLSTGYDHVNDAPLALGGSDSKWIVIRDPNSGTQVPRMATAIGHSGWALAQPGSQWIGPYPAGTTVGGSLPVTTGDEVYSYLYCFCLCDRTRYEVATLEGTLRADNKATVYLNGAQILPQTSATTFQSSSSPVHFSASGSQVHSGINCLRVDLTNESGGPSGFDVRGSISRFACCDGRTSRPPIAGGVVDPLAPGTEPVAPW